jgi:hypothetical protein
VEQDQSHWIDAMRKLWLAHIAVDQSKARFGIVSASDGTWSAAYERAIAAQPRNYPVWLDYIKTLESVKSVPSQTWLGLSRRAAQTFESCNEAGWALCQRCFDNASSGMTPAAREAFLLECHQDLRQANWQKPEGYMIDDYFNRQADKIGDPALALDFFGKLLNIHYSAKAEDNWIFGRLTGWGANRFAGASATAAGYAQAMGSFLQARAASLDPGMVASTITAGIRKASEAGDLASYQTRTQLGAKLLPPVKSDDVYLNAAQLAAAPKYPVFSGSLLSQNGMLRTSSA